MLNLGLLSFNSPWAFIGLLALPLIWWLLHLYPPAPTRIVFPPIILLRRLINRQESLSEVPLWLFVLRLLAAVAFILALAHPLINSGAPLKNLGIETVF